MRVCTSAGEAFPPNLGQRWTERTGTELLDGIGSTEMLHIFISNKPGEGALRHHRQAVPGYQVRLVDDSGNVITKPGELGELQISGPTSAIMYWNQREKTKNTFQGPLDAKRRQVQLRRRRLLHLRRPLRRHAEGERHLRLAPRRSRRRSSRTNRCSKRR
jgi:acyl-CoA synthetase (AMP-forming)/AMP-acid ligase II